MIKCGTKNLFKQTTISVAQNKGHIMIKCGILNL